MKFLKERKNAILIAVVVMIAATVFGVVKALNATEEVVATPQPTTPPVVQTPLPSDPGDVNHLIADDAGVLNNATTNYIVNTNIELMQKCDGAQIAVVVIENHPGVNFDRYAQSRFAEMNVASNGLLILLVTEEYDGWFLSGPGISGSLTQNVTDTLGLAYFWDYVDDRDYNTAFTSIFAALYSWYINEYTNIQEGHPGQQPGFTQPEQTQTSAMSTVIVFIVIFGLLIIIIIAMSATGDRQRHRMYYTHMGMPIPRYHWWYMWGPRPYRTWYRTTYHRNRWGGGPRGPRGPGGFGGGGRPGGGFGGGGRSGGGGRPGGGRR